MATQLSYHEGTDTQELENVIREFYGPGQSVEVVLSLPRSLTLDEQDHVMDELGRRGVEVISVDQPAQPYDYTLRLRFRRQSVEGYALLPILGIAAILGALGIGAVLVWGVKGYIDALARNMIPITLIVTGGLVLMAWVFRPAATALATRR